MAGEELGDIDVPVDFQAVGPTSFLALLFVGCRVCGAGKDGW